eukprot:31018-Pelagococcus_subviridis.AAC.33
MDPGRRETTTKVLKDRRSPRRRGRTGTSVQQNAPERVRGHRRRRERDHDVERRAGDAQASHDDLRALTPRHDRRVRHFEPRDDVRVVAVPGRDPEKRRKRQLEHARAHAERRRGRDEHADAARRLRVVPRVVQLRDAGGEIEREEDRSAGADESILHRGATRRRDRERVRVRPPGARRLPPRRDRDGDARRELEQDVVALRAVDEEDEDAGVRQVREAARGGGRAIRADYRGREQDRRERGEEGPPLHQSLRVLRDLQREAVREQEREDGERVEGLRRLRARHRARGGRAAMRRALHK